MWLSMIHTCFPEFVYTERFIRAASPSLPVESPRLDGKYGGSLHAGGTLSHQQTGTSWCTCIVVPLIRLSVSVSHPENAGVRLG